MYCIKIKFFTLKIAISDVHKVVSRLWYMYVLYMYSAEQYGISYVTLANYNLFDDRYLIIYRLPYRLSGCCQIIWWRHSSGGRHIIYLVVARQFHNKSKWQKSYLISYAAAIWLLNGYSQSSYSFVPSIGFLAIRFLYIM